MLADDCADPRVYRPVLDVDGKCRAAPSTVYVLDSRSFTKRPLLRLADLNGDLDVRATALKPSAARSYPSEDHDVYAGDLHGYVLELPIRLSVVLVGQQLGQHLAAVVHYATSSP